MKQIKKPSWFLPESRATSETIFANRRSILKAAGFLGAGAGLIGAGLLSSDLKGADYLNIGDPVDTMKGASGTDLIKTANLYPAPINSAYADAGRAITDEKINSTYNNFYEFGSHKQISKRAQDLKVRPWTIQINGMVEKPFTIDIDDLITKMGVEERIYRHRCVEAWSMTVPWSGFALSKLIDLAAPLSGAKYVEMRTFFDPEQAPGHRQAWYPWPYLEGMTMAEARNDLAFMVTGAYGKPLAKQFGAPLRLAVPWKYGFKSIKSIASITFTDQRPVSFWEQIAAAEYGFWANVNPEIDHPRWSQASERVLGTSERIPTQLYNGYAEQVAGLYKGLQSEPLYR